MKSLFTIKIIAIIGTAAIAIPSIYFLFTILAPSQVKTLVEVAKDPLVVEAEKDFTRWREGDKYFKDIDYHVLQNNEKQGVVRIEFTTAKTCYAWLQDSGNQKPATPLVWSDWLVKLSEDDARKLIAMKFLTVSPLGSNRASLLYLYYSSEGSDHENDWKRCQTAFIYKKVGDSWDFDIEKNQYLIFHEKVNRYYFLPPQEQEKIGYKAASDKEIDTKFPFAAMRNFISSTTYYRVPDPSEHWLGDKNAKVVIIEYCMFSSANCKKIHSQLHQLINDYKGKVAWVYRHVPGNNEENKSAEASECVADIGGNEAYWKFIDLNYADNPPPILYAVQAGVDKNTFIACLDSGKLKQRAVREQILAQAEGAGTGIIAIIYNEKNASKDWAPWIFSNAPIETYKKYIDEALAQ